MFGSQRFYIVYFGISVKTTEMPSRRVIVPVLGGQNDAAFISFFITLFIHFGPMQTIFSVFAERSLTIPPAFVPIM